MAEEWWDATGKFAPLHQINPVRLGYLRRHAVQAFGRDAEQITPFTGLNAIDIGCGGGLIAEPLARMGFTVTAIDGSAKNIAIAQAHQAYSHLTIDYQVNTAEALAAQNPASYDIVVALEVVEHVANLPLFLESLAALVKPNGLLVMSTLNRTAKSFALGIVAAEYLLRWLPRGTHDWKKFLKPHELVQPLQHHGLELCELQGMVYHPLTKEWKLSASDLAVNYLLVMRKR
jgi:2-polyprenyl-6-hydroxyphenyl methylase/3-demethylubiquinone-9 3-methyltransferase